jgi:chitinase
VTTPTNMRITARTPTSISLAWNASSDNSGKFWYCVQQNGSGCYRVNPPQTTLTRPSLAPDRTHTFSVYVVDAAGNRSANSNTVSYATPRDTAPPSPPPSLTLLSVFPTRISVVTTPAITDTQAPTAPAKSAPVLRERCSRGVAHLGPVDR